MPERFGDASGWRLARLTPLAVLLLAIVVLCGACQDDLEAYYPLQDGRSWQYRVSVSQGGRDPVVTEATVVNLARETVFGMSTVPQRSHLFGQTLVRYLADDRTGVIEHAQQLPGEPPQRKPGASYVLRSPVASGTSWSSSWRSARGGGAVTVPTVKAITGTQNTVPVPAGTFADCLHVRITGRAEVDVGGQLQVIEVSGDEWYAPGVGFIKGVFRETLNFGESTTELSIDLASYEKNR